MGLINATLVSPDHYVMSDIVDLTASLGQLSYEAWIPTRDQADTYLYAIGRQPDQSPYRDRLAAERRHLANLLLSRFGLDKLGDKLTAICDAVAAGHAIPDELHGLRLQPMP